MEVLYAASKFNNRKRSSKIEVIKALNSLGFTTWNELQSENDVRAGKTIKENLNEALNEKIGIVEQKRENKLKRDKRIAKLPDGPERRKLIFQASTEEKAQKRKKTDFQIEEQEIHESYQLLLKELAFKEKIKERERREKERQERGERRAPGEKGVVDAFRGSLNSTSKMTKEEEDELSHIMIGAAVF